MENRPDSHVVRDLVARCIEAIERGDKDPVTASCREAPQLETRVRQRLAQLEAMGLLQVEASAVDPKSIGGFDIVARLGSGGMGVVYHGRQHEPLRRDVAIKVIRNGQGNREIVARFLAERQALALMNHHGIAKLHDAGVTDDAAPYFVMELVHGVSLTTWCEEREAGLATRLRLFGEVCHAVQHAHQRGVIHRDLKPSNILVVEDGGLAMPKVIDFGVAKAVYDQAEDPASAAMMTRVGQVLGTPEYMSPEQALSQGADVDTRTDVYSLGVVLYELLSGSLPFESARLRTSSAADLERILLHEEPPPVDKLAKKNGREPLSRELHWICSKALSKDRERRYASPLELALDLERFAKHEPILAGPESLTYRFHKFVRRNRLLVAAASIVLVALVTSLVLSLTFWWQTSRARESERIAHVETEDFYGLARDAVFRLVQAANEKLPRVPRAERVRRDILEDALQFYDGLRNQRPRDPALRLDVAAAQVEAGQLLRDLGRLQAASEAFDVALRMLTELEGEAKLRARVLHARAAALAEHGRLLELLDRPQDAASAMRAALAAAKDCDASLRATSANKPEEQLADHVLPLLEARIRNNLVVFEEPPPQQAHDDLQRVVDLLELAATSQRSRDDAAFASEIALLLGQARTSMGDKLTELGRAAEAERTLQLARSIIVAERDADRVAWRLPLARADMLLLRLARRNQASATSREVALEGVDAARAEVADHPELVKPRLLLADILREYGLMLHADGRPPEALAIQEEDAGRREQARRDPPDAHEEALRIGTKVNLAQSLAALGASRVDDAVTAVTSVIEEASTLVGKHDESDLAVATAYTTRATLRGQQQQLEAACKDFAAAAAIYAALHESKPDYGRYLYYKAFAKHNHGWFLAQAGRLEEADPLLEAALRAADRSLTAPRPDLQGRALLAKTIKTLAHARLSLGRVDDSVDIVREVAERHPAVTEVQEAASLVLGFCVDTVSEDAGSARTAGARASVLYDAARYGARARLEADETGDARAVELLRKAIDLGLEASINPAADTAFVRLVGRQDFPLRRSNREQR